MRFSPRRRALVSVLRRIFCWLGVHPPQDTLVIFAEGSETHTYCAACHRTEISSYEGGWPG
jgi:hypothetical protein